jgi:hypothetical protein
MTAVSSRRRRARVAELRAPLPWRQSVMSRAWWLAPPVLALLLWMSLNFAVAGLDAATFRVYWKTPKFVSSDYTRLFVWCTVSFALASLAMTQVIRSGSHRRARGTWLLEPGFRKVIFRLFLFGVAVTFLFAAIRVGGPGPFFSQSISVVSGGGGSAAMREAFAPVSGLTSLTQLGLLIAMVETIHLTWRDDIPDRRASRRRLITVIVFGIVRSLLASERLAMVEILLPTAIVWGRARRLRSPRQAILVALAPFVAVFALFFLFAGTEYFRSYQSYKERIDDSLMEFSRNRLLGYYATALNNSAMHMEYDTPKAPFALALEGVLNWPGVRSTLQIGDPRRVDAKTLLEQYANEEFTNKSPPGLLILEGNSLYVVAVMAGFGAIAGAAYAGYRFGSVGGTVWFGIVFTSVVEFPRIWYLTSPRMSTIMVVALIGWFRYNRIGREHRGRAAAAPAAALPEA